MQLSFGWKFNVINFVRQAFYSATPDEERRDYGEAGRGQGDGQKAEKKLCTQFKRRNNIAPSPPSIVT
jgi:hypothetical protein